MLKDEYRKYWRALYPEGIETDEERNWKALNDRKLCGYYVYYENNLKVIEIITNGTKESVRLKQCLFKKFQKLQKV